MATGFPGELVGHLMYILSTVFPRSPDSLTALPNSLHRSMDLSDDVVHVAVPGGCTYMENS